MNAVSASSPPLATLGGETMGTSWSVKLAASANTDLHALHAGIQSKLDGVVRQMSTWQTDTDISRFNRAAAGTWQQLPDEFFTVLQCALDIANASGGAFNPAIGTLVALWGFGADAHPQQVPNSDSLCAARARVDWQQLQLQAGTGSALQPGGLRLDLSAIAKGYAVDAVATYLRTSGIACALVEVGGELYGYGRKPDGDPWRVLVETAPEEDDALAEARILDIDGIAVATSGDRWHNYERDGRRYSHTIDPRSGAPVEHAPAAVTVIAEDAMRADAWATALTVMGAQAGLAFARTHGLAARFVAREPAGLVETMTDSFKAHLAA